MSFEELIRNYGYAAVFLGTSLEGETIVVLAGFAAQQGFLTLGGVILTAFLGSLIADQTIFWTARRYGRRLLDRWPRWQVPAERAFSLLRRYDTLYVLSFRFLYGLRVVSPFVIGTSGVRPLRFLALNSIAAAVWATTFAGAGYLFGRSMEAFLGRIRHLVPHVLGVLAAVGLVVWLGYLVRERRRRKAETTKP